MSIILNKIASEIVSRYSATAPANTFFGLNLNKLDTDTLYAAAKRALADSEIRNYEEYCENSAEVQAKFDKEVAAQNEALAKQKANFETECVEAKARFDHELKLKEIAFEREAELKKLSLEHDEKLFVAESRYTQEIVKQELDNAKEAHALELSTEKAKFSSELTQAKEIMASEVAHTKAISAAEIQKAKEEAAILYQYDTSVLQKKLQAEVSDRFDELIKIAAQSESKDELIARLQADKDYFQNFAENRVTRSEDVTDLLVGAISDKAKTPVTVNVSSECPSKKSKKS